MPGFFSSNLANTLSSYSNYYIDWSRVGELLQQGTHRYSWQELVQRGIVLISTGVGGYLGYTYSSQKADFMPGLYCMSGCFVGFVVSHLLVISPLIYKRYQLSQACAESQGMILNTLQKLNAFSKNDALANEIINLTSTQVKMIMAMDLSNENHSNASLTWGRRRTLLSKLATELQQDLIELIISEDRPVTLEELEKRSRQRLDFFLEKEIETHPTTSTLIMA